MSGNFGFNNGFPRQYQVPPPPTRQPVGTGHPGGLPFQPPEFFTGINQPFFAKDNVSFDFNSGYGRPNIMPSLPRMNEIRGFNPLTQSSVEGFEPIGWKEQNFNQKRKNDTPNSILIEDKIEKKVKLDMIDNSMKKSTKTKFPEETAMSKAIKNMIAEVKDITRPMDFWPQKDLPDNFMIRYSLTYLNSKLDLIPEVLLTDEEIEVKKKKMTDNITGDLFDPTNVYGESMETENVVKSFKNVNEGRLEKKNQKLERLEEESTMIQKRINDHKRQLRKLESSYLIKLAEKDRAEKILDMVVRI